MPYKNEILFDLGDRTVIVYSHDDLEDFLEDNKRLRSMPQKSDFMRATFRVPNIIAMKWLNEEWRHGNVGLKYLSKEWDELVSKKSRDPDYKHLWVDK